MFQILEAVLVYRFGFKRFGDSSHASIKLRIDFEKV